MMVRAVTEPLARRRGAGADWAAAGRVSGVREGA